MAARYILLFVQLLLAQTTPAPVATASPACSKPDRPATVSRAVAPEYPEPLQQLGLGVLDAYAQVTVDPSGKILKATILKSSGYALWDSSTLRAARLSEYAPKLVDCHPTIGTYIFRGVAWPPNMTMPPRVPIPTPT
jgi:TonB family protein